MRRGITITVERDNPGGVDDYGDPVASTTQTHTIANCAVSPRVGEDELHDRGRAGVIVGLTLFAPAGADIQRHDRIVIAAGDPNAGRYEIEGEAAEWRSPWTGWQAGIQVALRRAEG